MEFHRIPPGREPGRPGLEETLLAVGGRGSCPPPLGDDQAGHCVAEPAVNRGRPGRTSACSRGSSGPVSETRTWTRCLRVAVGVLVIDGCEDVKMAPSSGGRKRILEVPVSIAVTTARRRAVPVTRRLDFRSASGVSGV